MAITKNTPHLKVQIFINGAPLEEHQDDEEDPSDNETTAYVEASSGANFEIVYAFGTRFDIKHDLSCSMTIDGRRVGGAVFGPHCPLGKGIAYDLKGEREVETGQEFLRRFRFADLDIHDGDVRQFDGDSKRRLKDVGTILVKFYWGKAGQLEASAPRISSLKGLKVIPEKALKGSALSHQASVGAREPAKTRKVCAFDKFSQTPFATFKFKYRSRAALKSLLIIPRSPSPIPLEERDVETLTAEESRQLIRRLRHRDRSAVPVKKEGVKREFSPERSASTGGTEHVDDDDVSFVSEKRKHRYSVSVDEEGVETIDLT